MSTETTPAVQRAAEAQFRRYDSEYDHSSMGAADFYETAREDIAAALNVEEMARAMVDHRRIPPYNGDQAHCSCGDSYNTRIGAAEHVATAIRTAILGADQ